MNCLPACFPPCQAVFHMPTSEDAEPSSSMPLALQSVFYKVGAAERFVRLQIKAWPGLEWNGMVGSGGIAVLCCGACTSPLAPRRLPCACLPAPAAAAIHERRRRNLHQGPHLLVWLGQRGRVPAARRARAVHDPLRPAGDENEGGLGWGWGGACRGSWKAEVVA